MTTAATPLFTLATEKALPAITHPSQEVIGGRLYEALSQCEKRGNSILNDVKFAMELGGGHAAQQTLIEAIKNADAEGCAVQIQAFNHS